MILHLLAIFCIKIWENIIINKRNVHKEDTLSHYFKDINQYWKALSKKFGLSVQRNFTNNKKMCAG